MRDGKISGLNAWFPFKRLTIMHFVINAETGTFGNKFLKWTEL